MDGTGNTANTAAWLARLGVYRLSGKVRYATAHASR
jgi:hypothetical protein